MIKNMLKRFKGFIEKVCQKILSKKLASYQGVIMFCPQCSGVNLRIENHIKYINEDYDLIEEYNLVCQNCQTVMKIKEEVTYGKHN